MTVEKGAEVPPRGRKPVVKKSDLDRYHGSSRARFRPAEQVESSWMSNRPQPHAPSRR